MGYRSLSIKEVVGDIFSSLQPGDLLVHGCNAQGVMGAGIARIVKDLFPGAFALYSVHLRAYLKNPLGTVSFYADESRKVVIANAITQERFGADSRQVCYNAVSDCFSEVFQYAIGTCAPRVIFPAIGAGLGGGRWDIIYAIINSELEASGYPGEVVFYKYD